MRAPAILGTVALLAACAASQSVPRDDRARATTAAPVTVAIRNAGFEEVDDGRACALGWSCVAHHNPAAFRFYAESAGSTRSFCVERVADEPWVVLRQLVGHEALRGSRLRLSMSVRVEGATGDGAGPWVLVEGAQVVHRTRLARGTSGWRSMAVDFEIPEAASALIIGATLEGPGKACFGDVRLEVRAAG